MSWTEGPLTAVHSVTQGKSYVVNDNNVVVATCPHLADAAIYAAEPELKVFATYAKYGTRIAPPESAGRRSPAGDDREAQSRKGNSRLEIVPRASALTPEGE